MEEKTELIKDTKNPNFNWHVQCQNADVNCTLDFDTCAQRGEQRTFHTHKERAIKPDPDGYLTLRFKHFVLTSFII